MPEEQHVIHAGVLTLRQKRREETVYVGVFDDSLRCWKAEEDFRKGAKPKLTLSYDAAANVEVVSEAFTLTVKKVEYTFRAATADELRQWLVSVDHVRHGLFPEGCAEVLRDAPLCEGLLLVSGLTPGDGPATLFCRLTTESVICSAVAGQPHMQQGQIPFKSIIRCTVDDECIRIMLEGREDLVVFRADKLGDHEKWLRSIGRLLRGQLGEEFKDNTSAAKFSSETTYPFDRIEPTFWQTMVAENPGQWRRRRKGMWWRPKWSCKGCSVSSEEKPPTVLRCKEGQNTLNLCEHCFASAICAPGGSREVLCQGLLDEWVSKKKRQRVFVVLYKEQLLLYKSPEAFLEKPDEPLRTIDTAGIDSFDVTDRTGALEKLQSPSRSKVGVVFQPNPHTFVVRLSSGAPEVRLTTASRSLQEAAEWNAALRRATDLSPPPSEQGAAAEEWSHNNEAHEKVVAQPDGDAEAVAAEAAQSEAAQSQATGPEAVDHDALVAVDAGNDEAAVRDAAKDSEDNRIEAPAGDIAEAASVDGDVVEEDPELGVGDEDGAEEDARQVVKSGHVFLSKDGGKEHNEKYVILYTDLLQVGAPAADGAEEVELEDEIDLADVMYFSVDAGHIDLRIGRDGVIKLKCEDAGALAEWAEGLESCKVRRVATVVTVQNKGLKKACSGKATAGGEFERQRRAITLIAGPVAVLDDTGMAEEFWCVLDLHKLAWSRGPEAPVVGRVGVRDIVEVDVQASSHPHFAVKTKGPDGMTTPALTMAIPPDSGKSVGDWTEAFEKAVAIRDISSSRMPSALPKAPGWSRKLHTIFEQCDAEGSGFITIAQLEVLCRQSMLVARALVVLLEELGSTETELGDILAALGNAVDDRATPLSWPSFLQVYVASFLPWGVQETFLVLEGPLEIRRGGVSEGVQHVILSTTCLETYDDAAAAARGTGCRRRIERSDVRSVSVASHCIIVELAFDEPVELMMCKSGDDLEPWASAFAIAFPVVDKEQGAAQQLQQSETSRKSRKSEIESRKSVKSQRSVRIQESENGDDASKSPRDAPPQRATRQRTSTAVVVRNVEEKYWWDPPANILAEAAGAMIAQWVASLPTLPVKTGLLGVQDRGGHTVPRFCALFVDRLEEWEHPSDAAHGKRPKRRIAAKDILGFETVGGGFVLNLGKRMLGVRVRTTDDMHLWSQALLEVLAPGDKAKTWTMVQTETLTTTVDAPKADSNSKHAPNASKKRTDRSIMDVETPKHYEKLTESRRASFFTARAAPPLALPAGSAKCFKFNTHKDGREAEEQVCGLSARILRYSDEPGADFVNASVATKVNASRDVGWQEPLKAAVADKITGQRNIPPRSKSANVSSKITEFDQVNIRRPRRSVGAKVRDDAPRADGGQAPSGADGGQAPPRTDCGQVPPGLARKKRNSFPALKTHEDPQGRSEVLTSRKAKAAMEPSAKVTEMIFHSWPIAPH